MEGIEKYFVGFFVGVFVIAMLGLGLFLLFPEECPACETQEIVAEECPVCQAQEIMVEPEPNFSGTWYSNWGVMNLSQSENKVSGNYDYNDGTIEGNITGNKLEFQWRENTGSHGTGYFVMSSDHENFDGRYKFHDYPEWAGSWHAYSTPPASPIENIVTAPPIPEPQPEPIFIEDFDGDFSGTWDSTWGMVRLIQDNKSVRGNYSYEGFFMTVDVAGYLEGNITGNRLDFLWNESTGGRGTGYFMMSSDEQNLSGKWKYDESQTWDDIWEAGRTSAQE